MAQIKGDHKTICLSTLTTELFFFLQNKIPYGPQEEAGNDSLKDRFETVSVYYQTTSQ